MSDPSTAGYEPNLGRNPATVQMYDKYFAGARGAVLKARIESAAKEVGLNPGLIAVVLLAEYSQSAYVKQTGEVRGFDIGTDDYKERHIAIERRIPAARRFKPLRYEARTNEYGRAIPQVPIFKADDAVLASAVYLKDAEIRARDAFAKLGGSFKRLPIEYQFAFTRYAMNAGPNAMKHEAMKFLGLRVEHGKFVHHGTGRDFLDYKPWKLSPGRGEQFSRHHPRPAATAHTAQAIHLSQKIFGVNPLIGGDSLMFVR